VFDDDMPAPSRFNTSALGADWGQAPRQITRISLLFVFLVAMLITAGIYLLAKSVLFG
jgi:hypothetical protein